MVYLSNHQDRKPLIYDISVLLANLAVAVVY